MSDDHTNLPKLEICWTDIVRGKEKSHFKGELLGRVNKLNFIQQELQSLLDNSNNELALPRLLLLIESYVNCVYALRERAVKLVCYTTGNPECGGFLKDKNTRELEINMPGGLPPEAVNAFLSLMSTLDQDVNLRNSNTHETSLQLQWWTETGPHDPVDALVDVTGDENAKTQLDRHLGEELGRQVDKHCKQIDSIEAAVHRLLEALRNSSTPGEA